MIALMEFLNCCVLAEIAEPGKKVFPSLHAPDKSRQDHDNLRVQHGRKVLDLAVDPRLVDLTHGSSRILAFGFVYHELLLLGCPAQQSLQSFVSQVQKICEEQGVLVFCWNLKRKGPTRAGHRTALRYEEAGTANAKPITGTRYSFPSHRSRTTKCRPSLP